MCRVMSVSALLVPRPVDALVFPGLRPARIACLEGGPGLELARRRLGCDWMSLEDSAGGRRHRWSTKDLGALHEVVDDGEILAYANESCGALEDRLLGCTPALARALADKLEFRSLARRLGVEVPSHIGFSGMPDHGAAAAALGVPYVLQTARGSAGCGTYFIDDSHDVEVATSRHLTEHRWLASELRSGAVVNVHVVVSGTVVRVLQPSVQLTGRSGLAPDASAYCGSDFSAANRVLGAHHAQFTRDAARVAGAFGQLGWRGIVGFDAIVDRHRVTMLEANPRLQASSWLLAELQRREQSPDIGDMHLAALNGRPIPATARTRHLRGATLAVRAFDPTAASALRPGIYRVIDGRLTHSRDAFGVADLSSGELFIDGVGKSGAAVDRGAIVARVSGLDEFVAADGVHLNSETSEVVAATLHALGGLGNQC